MNKIVLLILMLFCLNCSNSCDGMIAEDCSRACDRGFQKMLKYNSVDGCVCGGPK